MLTLYHDHNAVCCQKVELVLFEKGLEYDEKTVSLFKSEQYSKEYLQVNPRGIVPTLAHDGNVIFESTVICEYIEESFPATPLLPVDPFERAQARLWTKLVDDEIHEAASTLSFCAMFRDRMLAMPAEEREKRYVNVGNPIRDDMYRSSVALGVEAPVAFRAIASYEMMTRDLEKHLSRSSRDWIAGAEYSLAEVALTPYFARVEYLGLLDIWISERPLVQRWWESVKAREAFDVVFTRALSDDDIGRMSASGALIHDRVAARCGEYLSATAKA